MAVLARSRITMSSNRQNCNALSNNVFRDNILLQQQHEKQKISIMMNSDKFIPFIQFYYSSLKNQFGKFARFYFLFEEFHDTVIEYLKQIMYLEYVTQDEIDSYTLLLAEFLAKVDVLLPNCAHTDEYETIREELKIYLTNLKNVSNEPLWKIRVERMNKFYKIIEKKHFDSFEMQKITFWDSLLQILPFVSTKESSTELAVAI
jgi:hypothetical protein